MHDRGALLCIIEEYYYAKYRCITMQNKGGLLCKIEVHYYANRGGL